MEQAEPLHRCRKVGVDFGDYKNDKAAYEAREWLISQFLGKAVIAQPEWRPLYNLEDKADHSDCISKPTLYHGVHFFVEEESLDPHQGTSHLGAKVSIRLRKIGMPSRANLQ